MKTILLLVALLATPAAADEGYITGEWDNGNPIVSLHPKIIGDPSREYLRGFCDALKLMAFKGNPVPSSWRMTVAEFECK